MKPENVKEGMRVRFSLPDHREEKGRDGSTTMILTGTVTIYTGAVIEYCPDPLTTAPVLVRTDSGDEWWLEEREIEPE